MIFKVFSVTTTLIISLFVSQSDSVSLYSPDDPLHELDKSNFESVVYGKNHSWIIEFYSSWCGHCIRFAPKWKTFVRDIRTWRTVIDVAVINCADSQNLKICRDYDVQGFPTVRIYEPNINESVKGIEIRSHQDIQSIEANMIQHLEQFKLSQNLTSWPTFSPLDLSSLDNYENDQEMLLLLEHSDSVVGRQVMMDLSFQSIVDVRRALMTIENFQHLKTPVENSSLLVALKIDRKGKEELLLSFPPDANSSYIRDQIFFKLTGYPRGESDQLLDPKSKGNIHLSTDRTVHMTDLENALRYMLYQEIGVVYDIQGVKMEALKSILKMLKTYFPGKPHVMSFLSTLSDYISNEENITGEMFTLKMDELQNSSQYLPPMRDFVGCRGSEPRYRGYPCSLWTMFHTLSVSAYIRNDEIDLKDEAKLVLPNIKLYIKHFFTCEECVRNFFKMDQNIDREASSPSQVVLWLWAAHNQVNRRLAGDLTEDPQHPKVQFPSADFCPRCRLSSDSPDEIKWNEFQVLRFLHTFYSKKHIQGSGDNGAANRQGSFTSGTPRVISLKNVSFYEKWSFQWFTSADISLCVSLYVVSALLLILIFLLFQQRRRRKKSVFRYSNLYP